MITDVYITILGMNDNGTKVIKGCYEEPLDKDDKKMFDKQNIKYTTQSLEEYKGNCLMTIKFSLDIGVMSRDTFRENLVNINKKMLASRGAWTTDYRLDVRVS
jgi:hypothetical protein